MAVETKELRRIGAKGQITIPADILKRVGLKPGDYVAVQEEESGILLIPQKIAQRNRRIPIE